MDERNPMPHRLIQQLHKGTGKRLILGINLAPIALVLQTGLWGRELQACSQMHNCSKFLNFKPIGSILDAFLFKLAFADSTKCVMQF